MRLFRRGTRGAGALEYALLLFLILVVGFVAWKYLGGSVSGSTKSASDKFQSSGESAGAGAGGAQGAQDQGGKGAAGTKAPEQGGGGTTGGASKTGVAGGTKVATVEQGGLRNSDNSGPAGRNKGDPEDSPKRRNWIKLVIIIVVVLGMMVTLYTFGKKRAST
jgi:Flp pilus assembly pilin Flp